MTERVKFVAACAEERDVSFAALCRRFSISRETGYKWLARFDAEGPSGLEDRKPVARACPHRTDDLVVDLIVAMRKAHPTWGPKKLRSMLQRQEPERAWPAASTVGDVLTRQGLIRPRHRRVRVAPAAGSPLGAQLQPNDVWCTDFKGDFALGNGKRCYPLTITDGASRYLIKCEALDSTRGGPVRAQFELAFAEFGLPSRIRSDNGSPFASLAAGGLSALSVWWIQLGIVPERIEPGQPQQNGRHERMHRTLKAETTKPPGANAVEQQRKFDRFRHEYNDIRPHEALGQTPPRAHYEPSRRTYPRELVVPSYGDEYVVRWMSKGTFSWRGKLVRVTDLLVGQPVGIRQVSETGFEVHYGPVLLGTLDDRDKEPKLRRPDAATGATASGDGDGFAFSCGQAKGGLPTGKPPSPPEIAPNDV